MLDSNDAEEAALRDGIQPATQKDLLDRFRHSPVRMPRTQPELFQLLTWYNPIVGWDRFLDMIDFADVTPRQIHQVVLGRSPESAANAVPAAGYDARKHFHETLLSREFRKGLLPTFLRVFPSKGRDVFIHVPKCAGTDLILNLGRRLLPLPKLLELEGWSSDEEFLAILAGLVRAAMMSERFFVYGHMELGEYAETAGVRPDDAIFTVLRDPIDLMVSQANYVIGRLRQDPTGKEPDAASYLRLLGLTRLPEAISGGDLKALTLRALLNPQITEPNRACFYLGRGSRAVYARALENLIVHNVEVTTVSNYDRWLKERWGIGESRHHNRSEAILSNAEARRLCGPALAASTREDQKLYDVVAWALCQAGSASVMGQELAHLGGPVLTEGLQTNEAPAMSAVAPQTSPGQTILAAEEAKKVELYLAAVPAVSGAASMETVVAANFGANAGGDPYLLEGWARSEEKFTWTAAEQCTIRLPRLREGGRFIVRLVASPFVVKQRLPVQRVELLMDDVSVGACELKDISVIEAEVPAELLDEDHRLTVTLRLPTAVRPNTVSDSKDDRLLALAVRSMTVFRVTAAAA